MTKHCPYLHPDHWACEISVLIITERSAYANTKAQSKSLTCRRALHSFCGPPQTCPRACAPVSRVDVSAWASPSAVAMLESQTLGHTWLSPKGLWLQDRRIRQDHRKKTLSFCLQDDLPELLDYSVFVFMIMCQFEVRFVVAYALHLEVAITPLGSYSSYNSAW
jgi:hypothetical protein